MVHRMRKLLIEKWKRLSMRKADGHNHPDIKCGKRYRCKIDGQIFYGKFSRQWYGLFFEDWLPGTIGIQFDAPGTNSSTWEGVWEKVGK